MSSAGLAAGVSKPESFATRPLSYSLAMFCSRAAEGWGKVVASLCLEQFACNGQ